MDHFSSDAGFSAQDKSGRQGVLCFGIKAGTVWTDTRWENNNMSTGGQQ